MRPSHSGRAFHVAFATQAQEAFLEGYVPAFTDFGAVSARIRYDNLNPRSPGCCGRDRAESERFIALRGHYGFSELDLGSLAGRLRTGQERLVRAGMPRSTVATILETPVDLSELVFGSGETELESFDLTEPAFTLGFGDAGDQLVADLGDAGPLGGVGPVEGASEAAFSELGLFAHIVRFGVAGTMEACRRPPGGWSLDSR